ncbi:MAG: amidohydrolase family protein [Gammaproteobacteria bacterium]|nr:amidohydrolase family protein [Gammaproteobacteria bacterium]
MAAFRLWPDQGLLNPCFPAKLPQILAGDDVVVSALADLDASQLWDGHVHLIGTGDGGGGVWVNPHMRSILHPLQFAQFKLYTNAACADQASSVDQLYIERLIELHEAMPEGARLLLLAFDHTYDEHGHQQPERSAFYTPNEYAARITRQYPNRFEWIASIHPYREDCVEALETAVAQGARAVKWLPPGMGMNPASPLCDRFYEAMARFDVPLLSHAGEEKAVHGANAQDYGNPLLLRRALDHGLRVIVAHCASLGEDLDIDSGRKDKRVNSFDLFARMMDEPRYEGLLFGEISAITQINRAGHALETLISRTDWHSRLINASDYPLPGVMPLFSLRGMMHKGYITKKQAAVLSGLRKHHVLLFDLILKRCLQIGGKKFHKTIFHTRHVFDKTV